MQSGAQTGAYNMALDDLLLDTVMGLPEPTLIVRTYEWDTPTLSLGAHQPERDIGRLLKLYMRSGQMPELVKRPTGGRAILHGEDISFSFVTNESRLLQMPLKASYDTMTQWVMAALAALNISVQSSEETSGKVYLRSPVCFETQTPSDLLSETGEKLVGCAQFRRHTGLLQHGAAFIKPYLDLASNQPENFTQALFDAVADAYVADAYKDQLQPMPIERLMTDTFASRLDLLVSTYASESAGILERASTTVGSQLLPASC